MSNEANIKNEMVPVPNQSFALEELDGEYVLYDQQQAQAVYINETAAIILNLCDGERSVEAIRSLLEESYPQCADDLSDDLKAALGQLLECRAINLQ